MSASNPQIQFFPPRPHGVWHRWIMGKSVLSSLLRLVFNSIVHYSHKTPAFQTTILHVADDC